MPRRKSSKKTTRSKKSAVRKVTAKAAEVVKEKAPVRLPVDEVRDRLLSYADELQEYLRKVDATDEEFKFGVEKGEKGLTIDAAFKASISS